MKKFLVVEATRLEVAKVAFADRSDVLYAATYEEAIETLDREEIAGVLTDVFVPSAKNWIHRFGDELLKSKGYRQQLEWRMTQLQMSIPETLEELVHQIRTKPEMMESLRGAVKLYNPSAPFDWEIWLADNPSGLAVLERCLRTGIPCRVAPEGSRHHGNSGIVRNSLAFFESLHTSEAWDAQKGCAKVFRAIEFEDLLWKRTKEDEHTWLGLLYDLELNKSETDRR